MSQAASTAGRSSSEKRALLTDLLRQKGGVKTYPLSFGQERLWFLSQFQVHALVYNVHTALRLPQAVDAELLQRALDAVVERHESLRTSFRAVNGRPIQLVRKDARIALTTVDLTDRPEPERPAAIGEILAAEVGKPFDLEEHPLMRAMLIRVAPNDCLLALTMHHIVSDAWSMQVLLREFAAFYDGLGRGALVSLPPLQIQYGDFAAWQRSYLSGTELERHLSYWRRHLQDTPSSLAMPTDKPRPIAPTGQGAWQSFTLQAATAEGLGSLARAEGATLFMALTAVFLTLLRRYTGQDDLVIGAPIAGRNRPEIEHLIGFFVNTLVIRGDLSGDPTMRELVRRVKATMLDAYAHQDLPFEKLVAELQPDRDLSRNPLFQVAFGLENTPKDAPPAAHPADLSEQDAEPQAGTAKFDLTVMLSETASGLAGTVEYSTDLFEHASMARLIRHLKALAEAAAEAPDRPISALPMMSEDERQALLSSLDATREPAAAPATIHALIAEQAGRTPDALAVVGDDGEQTYRELDERANRMAQTLVAMGVQPGSVIGVCLPRSAAFLVAALAVLKAGGCYLPLDPSYPEDRLHFVLQDAAVAALITTAAIAPRLPRASAPVLLVDEDAAKIAERPATVPRVQTPPDSPVYMIYTSGSTGQPKGSLVGHAAFHNLVTWYVDELSLSDADAALIISALGFDLTQKSLFAPLTVGGRVHLHAEGVFDPVEIVRAVDRNGITLINCTPSAFYPLADAAAAQASDAMGSLRFAVLGGEAISIRRLWAWLRRPSTRAEIVNSYGPTECTDVVAFHRVRTPEALLDQPVPIGRPVVNTRLHVLDGRLEPCPTNVVGELYIGGPCVSMGYFGRPALTAEHFLPDPFSRQPGGRLYRTGDLARVRPCGTIEMLGRNDHQVKIRGFRIEPGEIEGVLMQHPAVENAAVIAEADGAEARLIAFVVPDAATAGPVRRLARLEQHGGLADCEIGELPNGLAVACMNRAETDFLYREIFADRAYVKHGVTLADGDCIFDVGGNIGLFSLFVAETVDQARIYAFEPLPPLARVLKANAAIHDIPVEVLEYGLAQQPGTDTFTFYPRVTIVSGRADGDDSVRRTMRAYLRHQDGVGNVSDTALEEVLQDRLETQRFQCDLKTLSEAIRETGVDRIDLLKIDVEQSEVDVLEGLDQADWAKVQQVVAEVHDIAGALDRVTAMLRGHGFDVALEIEEELQGNDIFMVYAVRPEARRAEGGPRPQADRRWGSRDRLIADLRRHIGDHLPDHMMPGTLAVLPSVPLSPNGKVDRLRLREMAPNERVEQRSIVHAATPLEHVVCGVMQDVLKLERIGTQNDFFELGGHSLLAVQVVSRLRDALQIDLPLRLLFERPTPASLAGAMGDDPVIGTHAHQTAEVLMEVAGMDELEVAQRLQSRTPSGERAAAI